MGIPYNITFHPSWWYERLGICFNKDFWNDPLYRMDADVKMRRFLFDKFGQFDLGEEHPVQRPILGSDLLASGFLHSQILGCEVIFSDNNPPNVICKNMSLSEASSLPMPSLDENPVWLEVQKQIDYFLDKFGYVCSAINLMGIQNIALDLLGEELFIGYYEEPGTIKHVLGIITDLSIEIGKRLQAVSSDISNGVTGILKQVAPSIYLTSNCTVEMVPLDIYEEFLLEYDRKLAKVFKPFGIHHCGKTAEHVSDGYRKVEGLSFIEAGAFSDVKKIRGIFPDIHINARYSPVRMMNASPEEIKAEVNSLAEAGKPLDSFSISCVGIDAEVPDDKITAFLSACRDI